MPFSQEAAKDELDHQPTIKLVGNEKTPLIIFDDALINIDSIYTDIIKHAHFEKESVTNYPGVRAKMLSTHGEMLMKLATKLIRSSYSVPENLTHKPMAAFYSIVTKAPSDLNLRQRIPHCDGNDFYSYAVMLYLSPEDFGGTGFYRHVDTGFETIDSSRVLSYHALLKEQDEIICDTPTAYMSQSTPQYQLIDEVAFAQNRLVIYPSNLLHSGLIDPSRDIYNGTGVPRLTANITLSFS